MEDAARLLGFGGDPAAAAPPRASILSLGDVFLIVLALLAWRLVRGVEHARDQLTNVLVKLRYLEKRVDALAEGGGSGSFGQSPSSTSDTASDDDGGSASVRGSARPLEQSAASFRECLLPNEDIDVAAFMAGCNDYSQLLGRMGPFAKLMVREVRGNVGKINGTYATNPEALRSARALLETEKNNGLHREGGQLADPSSAMGLLWARRGLSFWAAVFEGLAEAEDSGDGAVQVKKVAGAAYDEMLRPYNGWMTRSSFSMAINHMPDWESLQSRLGSSRAEVAADMHAWATLARQLVSRLKAMHTELDLEDSRKSI